MERDHNPMQYFRKWFYEADDLYDEREPNAMLLCTVNNDGFPESRMVLLKEYNWEGFIFYTNYDSNKARAIAQNPNVCLQFSWKKSGRIIQVNGKACKIDHQKSENYFQVRPRGSQLGAWASKQSQVVNSRVTLENQLHTITEKFKNKTIPKPDHWGGLIVKPTIFRFSTLQSKNIRLTEAFNLSAEFNWIKDSKYEMVDML